ncbi:twitching motility protein PilT [Brasilonema octagenarum UFV-E1]|uniref:Twitching motility protein PilT n=1 Tax=Brasilonema sennae CENA114 TaxID=415709 RepID=A0A856MEV1_9CYAN|nr:PIN domain-containing protein [Brasilonema sennae]QDL08669.1 twitching motility protein PilT [Brasilonema sennae CENA114]QDL15024.1 twitching motility protein PilT [Brasilonema octagenarum UFV-E1]
MKYVIDTHALIWFLEGNPRLGSNAKTILSNPESQLIIPATALAEAVWIVERGRTSISSATALLSAVNADSRIVVYPLGTNVIQQTIGLAAIAEMHDRQIVATAIVLVNQGETVVLLTCDQNITASGLVTIIW